MMFSYAPAGCKLALLPVRDADGLVAAAVSSWFDIAMAARMTYRGCVLPASIAAGGYRSTGKSIMGPSLCKQHRSGFWTLALTRKTGTYWGLVVVLYEPGSYFDFEVLANVSAGIPIVAEKREFESAYGVAPSLQIISGQDTALVPSSAITT